jgi:hypothetical protein
MVVEREDHRVILNENCGNSERRSTVVKNRIDALEDFRKQLEGADVDLLREMVKIFAGPGRLRSRGRAPRGPTRARRGPHEEVPYFILQTAIIAEEGPDSRLGAAVGPTPKGKVSSRL